MSKTLLEGEVRRKYGDLFDTAFEYIESGNDTRDLVMHILRLFAQDDEGFKEFMAEIKEFVRPSTDVDEPSESEAALTSMILENFGHRSPDALSALLESVARKLRIPKKCGHPQLYAHTTVDIPIPIEHNSALEMTRVLDRVATVLSRGGFETYKVRSGIKVNTDAEV
jgi:hypothetical protein